MGRKKVELQPDAKNMLHNMGLQIRLARLRRDIAVDELASKAGISRATVWAVEKGMESVAVGNYAAVIDALKLSEDLNLIAREDHVGHRLMDEKLPRGIRGGTDREDTRKNKRRDQQ